MSVLTKVFVVCDHCGTQECGHETAVGSPQKQKAREELRKKGWWGISPTNPGSRLVRDLCPVCVERKER